MTDKEQIRRMIKEKQQDYLCLMQDAVLYGGMESVATYRDKAEACNDILKALAERAK